MLACTNGGRQVEACPSAAFYITDRRSCFRNLGLYGFDGQVRE